jgi:hypothetical protein
MSRLPVFARLDAIDWKRLGSHVYADHGEIPGSIRKLLSPDAAVREQARGFLLGSGQDYGDIYDTTPQIIPFCLEVLAMDGAPGKAELMFQLSGQGAYIARAERLSVHMMELCVKSYAALRGGLDIYLEFLAHGDRAEKLAACELLGYMTDDPQLILPELFQRVDQEADEGVQLGELYCLKQIFASLEWPHEQLKQQYAPRLQTLVEEHPRQRVRLAAARVSVELARPYRVPNDELISGQVAGLLTSEFLLPGQPLHWSEDYPLGTEQGLVRDLARLPDSAPLLHLLAEPGITAAQAQLLARGLLCQTFLPPGEQRRHWQRVPRFEKRKEGDFFLAERTIQPWQLKTGKVAFILQSIIAQDRVWERPSNLFSYFYGLPDSREALRNLVDSINTEK